MFESLNDVEQMVKDRLEMLEGTQVLDYTQVERISAPTALLVPTEPYMTPAENGPFGHWDVGLQILLIPRGGESAASQLRTMLIEVINLLSDDEFDVTAVSAPGRLELDTLSGSRRSHWGLAVTLEFTIQIREED